MNETRAKKKPKTGGDEKPCTSLEAAPGEFRFF